MDKILYTNTYPDIPSDFTGWTNTDRSDVNCDGQLVFVKDGETIYSRVTTKVKLMRKSKLGKIIWNT